jgi:hypothetical protein
MREREREREREIQDHKYVDSVVMLLSGRCPERVVEPSTADLACQLAKQLQRFSTVYMM